MIPIAPLYLWLVLQGGFFCKVITLLFMYKFSLLPYIPYLE